MTAAHCLQSCDEIAEHAGLAPFKTAAAGFLNVDILPNEKSKILDNAFMQRRDILKMFTHPKFVFCDDFSIFPDLALILLEEPFIFNQYIGPVNLALSDVPLDHSKKCVFCGFGIRKVPVAPTPGPDEIAGHHLQADYIPKYDNLRYGWITAFTDEQCEYDHPDGRVSSIQLSKHKM